jgi:hypothetical protein
MRVDYQHAGKVGLEIVCLQQIVNDGPWAGSRTRLIDDTGLGKYRFEVLDVASGELLYSRGFCSLYGEWETTAEAKTMHRSFHESLRSPWPKKPVQMVLSKRKEGQTFEAIAEFTVDPASRAVNPAALPPRSVRTLIDSGPCAEKVDLVLIGAGYTAAELPKFHADADRLVAALFATEPFKSRRADFNVRTIEVAAPQSGVSRPHAGRWRRNPTGAQYGIFDSERYLLTYDNETLRDILSAAPYDFSAILVNEKQYGGGGIHNFQLACAVDSKFADYVFVHEFGHHFAALADEYYTSDVAYETGGSEHPEPWEPNITALLDPAELKWVDLVELSTPLPTPWNKSAYEEESAKIRLRRADLVKSNASEAAFDALFAEQRELEISLLRNSEHYGKVGAFEGAGYEAEGLFRPEIDCIMFSRNAVSFCRVCRRAIEQVIDQYAR